MTHIDRRMHRSASHASTLSQYWVVGGEFTDTEFTSLHGPAEALGPFANYERAYREWERRSMETRPNAHTRYTIVGSLPR